MRVKRSPLLVACLLDSDIHQQVERSAPRSTRARADVSVVRTLQSLYTDVRLLPIETPGHAHDVVNRWHHDVLFNLAFSGLEEEAVCTAILESGRIPFTGSGASAIALANDKPRARRTLKSAGVLVPRSVELPIGRVPSRFPLRPPLLVKPAKCAGGSYGIYADSVVASTSDALARAGRLWSQLGLPALCDEFIVGREFRVGAIEDPETGEFRWIRVTEALFPRAAVGWGFKTQSMRSNERVRLAQGVHTTIVRRPKRLLSRLRALVVTVCKVLDVRGYVTFDVRLDASDQLVIIDVNTNPGLSERSLTWGFPSFRSNVRRIVQCALARDRQPSFRRAEDRTRNRRPTHLMKPESSEAEWWAGRTEFDASISRLIRRTTDNGRERTKTAAKGRD